MHWTPIELEYDVLVICIPVRKHSCLLLRLCILLQGECVSWQLAKLCACTSHTWKATQFDAQHARASLPAMTGTWAAACSMRSSSSFFFFFCTFLRRKNSSRSSSSSSPCSTCDFFALVFLQLAGRQVNSDLKSTCWWNISVPPHSLCQAIIGSSMGVTRESTVHDHGGKQGGGWRRRTLM
jgi:hypothetical protein